MHISYQLHKLYKKNSCANMQNRFNPNCYSTMVTACQQQSRWSNSSHTGHSGIDRSWIMRYKKIKQRITAVSIVLPSISGDKIW